MINLLVWSKDRACQLDCLLRSLPKDFFGHVTLIYKTSDDKFDAGYNLVKKNHPNVIFWKEGEKSLADLTTLFLNNEADQGSKIALSTDDTVIFKEPPMTAEEVEKTFTLETVTFSLRYGFNTIVQDCHQGTYQPSLNVYQDNGKYISWNADHYHPFNNYGYQFGLDLHVYDGRLFAK